MVIQTGLGGGHTAYLLTIMTVFKIFMNQTVVFYYVGSSRLHKTGKPTGIYDSISWGGYSSLWNQAP